MRLPLPSALAALFCLAAPAAAESIRILVQSSPLAGSQYHSLARVWNDLRLGQTLQLTREADNAHDRNAVRVDWRGEALGYVPRAENRAVASALDGGQKLEARISKLRASADPWQRVEIEIYLVL